jgi:hypothetical protein
MILVYLGLVSLQHRNIYVVHSGDHLLSLAAFYMMFAPCDAALSLDRIRRIWFSSYLPPLVPEKRSIWAAKAYQLQFMLIYWQTSFAKFCSPIWRDGTAMYYVFRYEEFARFPVPFVPNNMLLMKLSTWFALFVEFWAWMFIWFKETKYYVLLTLLALHLGIEYAMNIPVFEHIMIASLVIFIPAEDLTFAMNKIKAKAVEWFGQQPLTVTYNGELVYHRKLVRTIQSFDILGLVRVVNLRKETDPVLLAKLPREAQSEVLVHKSDTWLAGHDATRALAAKLPFFWITYPFLCLLS